MHTIVFCGIQGSGKSTFFRERFYHTHVRLNLDLLKTRHRENILLHACLAAQQPFVSDNTNVRAEQRAYYLRLARAAGFRVECFYFESEVGPAIVRNQERPEAQRVPSVAIGGTFKKLERPTTSEG